MKSSREKLAFVAIGGIALYGGFQLLKGPNQTAARVADSTIVWQLPEEAEARIPVIAEPASDDSTSTPDLDEKASIETPKNPEREPEQEPVREPVTVRASTSLAQSSPATLPPVPEAEPELVLSGSEIQDLPETESPASTTAASTSAVSTGAVSTGELPAPVLTLNVAPSPQVPEPAATEPVLASPPAISTATRVPEMEKSSFKVPENTAAVPETAMPRTFSPTESAESAASEHLEYGKSLARRGAIFAAREEYLHALRLICESGDRQSGTREFTTRLARGLKALAEAEDFFRMSAEEQLRMDLSQVLQSHETRLIAMEQASSLTAIQAMQMYCEFAVEQISQAVGSSVVAGETLHAMGKLMIAASRLNQGGESMHLPKAMVMYQAAMAANPRDYRSANELGVLMAEAGQWRAARDVFARSLLIHKTSEAWLNIARVHEMLGEKDYARRAQEEYEAMSQKGNPETILEWASASQFDNNGMRVEVPSAESAPRTAMEPDRKEPSAPRGILESVRKWF